MVEPPIFPGLLNSTRIYSPIIMSSEWSTLGRLVVFVFASCFGATLNGYFISAFFVERDLKHIANAFHVCTGMADMLITGGVIPMATAVLLSGVWDTNPVCHVLQTLTACSTYCYSIFYLFVSGKIYFRVCNFEKKSKNRMKLLIAVVATFVLFVGITLGATGTYLELDYDYCQRRHFGNFYYRQGTLILVHGTSFVFTMYTLIASYIRTRQKFLLQPRYRKSVLYQRDISMIKLNLMAYLLHVTFWLPHLIVINVYPYAPDSWYYITAWAGICRPLFTSMFYGSLNSVFGRAYSNIFNYCCCKTSIHNYPRRHRRSVEHIARPANVDVRIHIMQRAVPYGRQRATSSMRETTEL